ncbi:hypothetical protein GCM10025857_37120 [Alicyclobacillus contaminans]|uniref:hypothetical protein n=1 Tax=Alicyclobacillus contaminans TaxID=392016 RepID=UPI00041A6BFF|nr:hypothetical protein [Alicyclobacillus contaminans]GMA52355.1 hypothetical protein GCM10025857_37120 [Alicyclobacillus contaminans]
MRGRVWRTIGFLFVGAVIGTLAGQLLAHQFPVFGRETSVRWNPSADLGVVKFSLDLFLRVNWLTLAGAVAGYFVQRKWK